MTLMHALILPGLWLLCGQSLWSHFLILNNSLLVSGCHSGFQVCPKKSSGTCLSVLNHYTVILQSVMSQLQLLAMSVVCHLSGTSQPLSTWHSFCNQMFLGLYQVFLSNWEHSGKYCLSTSAAGASAVCRKSAKGLWKLDKDSLQSNYPVLV